MVQRHLAAMQHIWTQLWAFHIWTVVAASSALVALFRRSPPPATNAPGKSWFHALDGVECDGDIADGHFHRLGPESRLTLFIAGACRYSVAKGDRIPSQ
jgi:hypothetical protein